MVGFDPLVLVDMEARMRSAEEVSHQDLRDPSLI
jgi:hypothetical protein